MANIDENKLKAIENAMSQIEKQFGKKAVAEALSDVIIKPAGKPTLVSEDDKRPALGTEDAVNDFISVIRAEELKAENQKNIIDEVLKNA